MHWVYLWMIIDMHSFLVCSLQIAYKMNIESSLEKLNMNCNRKKSYEKIGDDR